MAIVKIEEAIEEYNKNREKGDPKLTQRALGEYVFPDMDEATAEQYISKWKNDKAMTKLGAAEIIKICLKTGVSPNFLFDWEETQIG